MIRTALDSDNLAALTTGTDFLFTYSDLVHDAAAFEAQHHGQQVVYIDRGLGDPDLKATIADVETGALKPSDLAEWFDTRFHQGIRWLTHYCDRNTLPTVKQALGGRIMWEWVATLDGTVHIDGYFALHGPTIVQIIDADHLGIDADFSLVLDDQWRPSDTSLKIQQGAQLLRSISAGLNRTVQLVNQEAAQLTALG